MTERDAGDEPTYPLRTAARLTGLSPELLRAWERRYGVVRPLRTPGGTRRYRAEDLERLRLVKAAVDAGHRIGSVAGLDLAELRRRVAAKEQAAPARLDEVLRAIEGLDGPEAQRLLSVRLAALGPARFAREIARPLVREIGERWASGRMGVASEHLATSVLRSLLGASLQPSAASLRGPRIVFATPSGERHELGLEMAALTAMGAGANPIYLGADLPVEELLGAALRTGAAAVALSLASAPPEGVEEALRTLRDGLPAHVRLFVGGRGSGDCALPRGAERVDDLADFEQRVALLES